MPQLLGIHIKNFKCLKDITLGKFSDPKEDPLSNLTSLIGKNSSGKSSFFEVFAFISDCLKFGVEKACLLRGGLSNLITKDTYIAEQKAQFNKTTSSTLSNCEIFLPFFNFLKNITFWCQSTQENVYGTNKQCCSH